MTTLLEPEQVAKPKKEREPTVAFKAFTETFQKLESSEEKLRLALDFMRASLSMPGNPKFEDFWAGKKEGLPLFKESLNPTSRTLFWAEYIELSGQAKKLKEILDEQSAFAVEQIELAITALEQDLEHYDQLVEESLSVEEIFRSFALKEKQGIYQKNQKELDLLNTLASRVNGLRKEVIKTGMRIRQKSKFFERLSSAGDKIFPKRKELIKQVSDQFCADVEQYLQKDFPRREEIKTLQAIAKLLTLNTHAFTATRTLLSAAWDKLKEKDQERRKEQEKFEQQEKQERERMLEIEKQRKAKVQELKDKIVSALETNTSYEELAQSLQQLQISKSEKMLLEKSLKTFKDALVQKKEEALLETPERENLKTLLVQRKERRNEIKEQLEVYRKALGGSGFDFEKAMMYRELINEEKERLDKAHAAVLEIEDKLDTLE